MTAREADRDNVPLPIEGERQPFVRFRQLLQSYDVARASGQSDEAFVAGVETLDAAVARTWGKGFVFTPFRASRGLGNELGLPALWIKDETVNVAASHKARHLFGLALHLRAQGFDGRARLAIASCGNAALAAAVIARAAGWELDAYVPEDADQRVTDELVRLGANLVPCARGEGGPPGDPCFHAMRAAVGRGAIAFTCQGTEDQRVLEGGATLGWELIAQHASEPVAPIGAVAIQVGGGALGTAVTRAFDEARRAGWIEGSPRFFPVQSRSVAPFARAWRLLARDLAQDVTGAPGSDARDREMAAWLQPRMQETFVLERLARARAVSTRYMWPWASVRKSIATGILDDVTYDWFALALATMASGGWPLVVSEETLARANRLAREHTGIDVGPTGSAGLAGLLDLAAEGALDPDSTTVALFTGRT